ncbi:MAG: FAD-binding protein [SAR92 clade bacterium]|nr:FAD-binding protein [SAR92 clade bacterium]
MSEDDSNTKNSSGGVTRRDILKLGAITAATLAVPTVLKNLGATSMSGTQRERYDTDILIIGTGFAGIFAAVEARKNGQSVVMLDKGSVGWSGLSPWASDSRPFDPSIYSREEWHHNIATNTEWVNDRKWLDIFMDESLGIFDILEDWGIHDCKPFERSKVFRQLLLDDDVTLVERTMVTSFIKDEDGKVAGAVGFTYDDSQDSSKAVVVTAKAVIMCTGAGAYKSPGFPNWGQTFDGDAMAYEAGAFITGKEYHDTHPTLSDAPAASYEGWVWAQSVVGAYIMVGAPDPVYGGLNLDMALGVAQGKINRDPGVGPGGEEAPTAGAGPHPEVVRNQKYRGKGFLVTPGLELDFGGFPEAAAKQEFGFRVGGATAGMGVHKSEGVFNSDYTCKADGVDGLYAAGDALGSMMCGSSYPARGFSSYGSAIQGRLAAKYASEYAASISSLHINPSEIDSKISAMWAPRENKEGFSPDWLTKTLQNTMTPFHILYIKEERRLEGALSSIEYLRRNLVPNMIARDGHELRLAHEAANMLLNAEMKLRAGLFRTESRGTHFREEYPARNDKDWLCWVLMQKGADGAMQLSKHMLPEEWWPDQSVPYRQRYPRQYPGEDEYLASRS